MNPLVAILVGLIGLKFLGGAAIGRRPERAGVPNVQRWLAGYYALAALLIWATFRALAVAEAGVEP